MAIRHLDRRDFFKLSAAGAVLSSLSGWFDVLAARAAGTRARHKSCILLWMDGGPSHKDTFDLKPGTRDAGEFQPRSPPPHRSPRTFPEKPRSTQPAPPGNANRTTLHIFREDEQLNSRLWRHTRGAVGAPSGVEATTSLQRRAACRPGAPGDGAEGRSA